QPILERRGHQHMRVAELYEAGPLGILHDTALERDRAQLVGLSAARSHAGLLDMGKLLGASAATDKRARGGRGTSAADLKFLHRVPRVRLRNFKSKSGTRIIELLVPFGFRSSYSSVPRYITNFEFRALAHLRHRRAAMDCRTRVAGMKPSGHASPQPGDRLLS